MIKVAKIICHNCDFLVARFTKNGHWALNCATDPKSFEYRCPRCRSDLFGNGKQQKQETTPDYKYDKETALAHMRAMMSAPFRPYKEMNVICFCGNFGYIYIIFTGCQR